MFPRLTLKASLFVVLVVCSASADKLRQVAVLDLPGRPGGDSVAFTGKHLVIGQRSSNSIQVFDVARRRIVANITRIDSPRALAADPANSRLFVATGNNAVTVISTSNWQYSGEIALEHEPASLLYVPKSNIVVVSHAQQPGISIASAEKGSKATTVALEGHVERMAFDPARNLIVATLADRARIVAFTFEGKVERHFDLVASQPTDLVLDPQSRRLYVAVRYAVLVLNADTGSEIARLPMPAGTDTLWLDGPSGTLYAAAADGTVTMVKVAGNQFATIQEMRTNVKGRAIAFDPEKKLMYLPGGLEGRAKLAIFRRIDPVAPGGPPPAGEQIVQKR